jgi:glutamate--cysteine ligase
VTDFRQTAHAPLIESVDQLVERMHAAGKPREKWRVGTEYEKPAVERTTGRAVPFSGPRGIETVLRMLAERFDWAPKEESGRVVALERGGASITLEPGAQLELSGEQCATVHCARRELTTHVREIVSVGDELGIAFLGLGIQPISRVDEIEWVPKPRYQVMGPYMARVGTLGQRMMKQTATVQVNLDYSDERDAMRKFRVGMAIAPLLNAMFANSPISDGQLNGFMSFRGHIWTDTDAARCGLLPFAFRDDAGFIDYVRWALDVPMYFILRRGEYRTSVTGVPFRQFLEHGADGERATIDDWSLHLTTLFPEVRLKGYIELRSTDSQAPERMLALPALAKGIFYMPHCLDAAFDMIRAGRGRTPSACTATCTARRSAPASAASRSSSTRASCTRSPRRGSSASVPSTMPATTSASTSSACARICQAAARRRATWSRSGTASGTVVPSGSSKRRPTALTRSDPREGLDIRRFFAY